MGLRLYHKLVAADLKNSAGDQLSNLILECPNFGLAQAGTEFLSLLIFNHDETQGNGAIRVKEK